MAFTTPDNLPYPDDYADPADTPAALEALALASQAAMVPVGFIGQWPTSTAPPGWHLCDGSAHGSEALAIVLGSPNTPNLRDRFIVGAGAAYAVGNTGGEASHTLTEAEMPPHSHQPGAEGGRFMQNSSGNSAMGNDWAAGNVLASATGFTGGGQPHENRPPYYALTYIIRKA